jgi:hypothetical protein
LLSLSYYDTEQVSVPATLGLHSRGKQFKAWSHYSQSWIRIFIYRIWGFHGSKEPYCNLLGYYTMSSCKWVWKFWRNILPPLSGIKWLQTWKWKLYVPVKPTYRTIHQNNPEDCNKMFSFLQTANVATAHSNMLWSPPFWSSLTQCS